MTSRKANLERKTRETCVCIELDIDGTGTFNVNCENQFLKHMIETLARYASFDINMNASGDNDHHLVEDVAISLGTCLKKALNESPIERMHTSIIPMDDALVMVSIDLIDRPFADIDCLDSLYSHFFRSLAMSSGITLHTLKLRGSDEHHIVEATFKALGVALKNAVTLRNTELSTKDSVKVK